MPAAPGLRSPRPLRDDAFAKDIADAPLASLAAFCASVLILSHWTRLPREIALEETEMFRLQAANLKAELRRVMDCRTCG